MNYPKYQINNLLESSMDIEVNLDEQTDINSFYENIFNDKYIKKWGYIKKYIFSRYPELEKKLTNITETEIRKKIIYDYVRDLYTKNYPKLQAITQKLKSLFEKNREKIIEGLSKTMDFDPKSIPHITITPTLKPNSTFGAKTINLSITSELFKNGEKPYIDIFIHEMTHIIWNQKIGKIYDSVGTLGSLVHEDLKEIIAPIILRDNQFKCVLQSEEMKVANDKQQLLQISTRGAQYNIVDYFETIYQKMKRERNSFEEIMKTFVILCLKIEDQMITKHKIYEECRSNSHNKKEAFKNLQEKGYTDPIILP